MTVLFKYSIQVQQPSVCSADMLCPNAAAAAVLRQTAGWKQVSCN